MDSAYFSGRSGCYLIFFRKFFFGFQNLDPLYRPVAGKPLVLKVLCLEVGTSVASAGTAKTIFESIKCMCDVNNNNNKFYLPERYAWPVRMGSKSQIFMFFNSGYAHDRNISILDVGHRQ